MTTAAAEKVPMSTTAKVLFGLFGAAIVGLLIYIFTTPKAPEPNPYYNPKNPNSNPNLNTGNQTIGQSLINNGTILLDHWLKGDFKNPFGSGNSSNNCPPSDCCGNFLNNDSTCSPIDASAVCNPSTDC